MTTSSSSPIAGNVWTWRFCQSSSHNRAQLWKSLTVWCVSCFMQAVTIFSHCVIQSSLTSVFSKGDWCDRCSTRDCRHLHQIMQCATYRWARYFNAVFVKWNFCTIHKTRFVCELLKSIFNLRFDELRQCSWLEANCRRIFKPNGIVSVFKQMRWVIVLAKGFTVSKRYWNVVL